MMHWCLGMHSSGSTWAYNVTMQIAASLFPTRQVQPHFVYATPQTQLRYVGHTHRALPDDRSIDIVKSHNIDDEDQVAALATHADAIVVTIRDPRDAVVSLMLYQRFQFQHSLSLVERSARLCARFAGEPRSLLLRYETGFADDVTTLDRIAETFKQQLTASDRDRIFASARRSAVEALIAELPRQSKLLSGRSGDLFDPTTHWHAHHAGRTGEIGRWRQMLTETQAAEVERQLGDWLDRFAYQRHQVRQIQPGLA
jgi:hypothetical protein